MTPQQFSDKMTDLYGLVSGNFAKTALGPATEELYVSIRRRITERGQNSEGTNIGRYSAKPLYATKQQFAKPGSFRPQGKNNRFGNTIGDRVIPSARLRTNNIRSNPLKYQTYTLVKPNLKPRRSMYLKGGYKELRDIQGLRTDIVNFKYRGTMMGDFSLAESGQEYLIGFKSEKESVKRKGLEGRFGIIFSPTQQEIKKFHERAAFSIARLTVGILKGETVEATLL